MIGLDTNVLVRYVAQDDPKQSPMANRLIERFANAAGCDYTATFDRDAAKHCGMRLIG